MSIVTTATLGEHNERVWCVAWNHTGQNLASCGGDKCIRIWSLSGDKWICQAILEGGHERAIRRVVWSPCGGRLASASFDATVCIWDKRSGQFESIATLEGHENEVKSVAWSVSGSYLATCSRDKSVWVWEAYEDDEFECAAVISAHTQDVKDVKWHPTEDVFASASYDDTIKIFAEDDGEWVTCATLEGHTSTVWSLAWDKAGDRIVSVSDDKTMKIWKRYGRGNDKNISIGESKYTWKCICTMSGYHERTIYCVDWCHLTGLIATGCGDDCLRIFEEDSTENDSDNPIFSLKMISKHAHSQDLNSVAWNPAVEGVLATASDDGDVKIWKVPI